MTFYKIVNGKPIIQGGGGIRVDGLFIPVKLAVKITMLSKDSVAPSNVGMSVILGVVSQPMDDQYIVITRATATNDGAWILECFYWDINLKIWNPTTRPVRWLVYGY